MIEKKFRVIASTICFVIMAIAMCLLLSYSLLRVMNLFLNEPSLNRDYFSLHFFAGIFGIIVSSFGLPFSIYFVYICLKENKDDKNVYNCFGLLCLVYYVYKAATMFFYMYVLYDCGGHLDGFAISVPVLFSISTILSFLLICVKKFYQKKILSIIHCSLGIIALILLLIYEVDGFPIATAIAFLVTDIAILSYSFIGLPSLRLRLDRRTRQRAIELENSYDEKEIDEETLYLEETRIRLKEK